MTPCGALRTSPTSSTTQRQQAFEFGFFCFIFFVILLWWRILHRYASTSRQRYVQKPLHRAAFMRRYSYTGVCAQINFYTQTPLHRGFYAKKFYTQKCLYTDALHKDAFTRINTGTQALLHTEPFTHNLCTEQLLHKETFITQKNFDTEKMSTQTAQRNIYTPKLYIPRAAFIHRNFSAQKPLGTEVSMHSRFYTGPFTHRCLYTEKLLHTETSAHSTLFHSQFLHGETLLPLLDYLPFVFPLSRSLKWFWLKLYSLLYTTDPQDTRTLQIVPCQQLVVNARLTCDAFGVLPPVSKLTPSQAMPHGWSKLGCPLNYIDMELPDIV